MMRVLLVSHLYPTPNDTVSGSFVHSQVKALIKQGCHVTVVAPTPWAPFPLNRLSKKWRKYSQIPKNATLDGVDIIYPRIIRTPQAKFFQYAGELYYHALKKLITSLHKENNFDLIHAQVGYPDGYAAAKLAKQLNLPLVVTCHGQELQIIVNKSPKLKQLTIESLKSAERVIVTGPKLHKLATQHNLTNLTIIPNGLDKQTQTETKTHPLIQENTLPPQPSTILSVANLLEQKGIQHVIQALKHIKPQDLLYLVVGDGPYMSTLQALAKEQGLADKVFFAGQIPHSQIYDWYSKADLFIMPSRDEAFGMVYLEAMQAGLPIIGCQGEGIMPQIEEAIAGIAVPFNNPQSIKEAIEEVKANPAKYKENAKRLAAQYCWENNALAQLQVYKEVTKRHEK